MGNRDGLGISGVIDRRMALSLGLVGALSLGLRATVMANDAGFRVIQYHALSQPVIVCPSGLLCEVTLETGERVKDGLNSQAPMWDPHLVYEGDDPRRQVPHIGVQT